MSRTSDLMNELNRLIRVRNQNRDVYLDEMAKYEGAKGTVFYTQKMKEARNKRDQADAEARRDCAEKVDRLLQDMQKAAERRSVKPLTVGQQMLIDSLKEKTRLTVEEVEQAARAMNGNVIGLRHVQEIERIRAKNAVSIEHRVPHNYMRYADPEMSDSGVRQCMDQVKSIVKDVFQSSVTRAGQVAMRYARIHGRSDDPDEFPQKKPFASEADLYGKDCELFCQAVNGGIE